MTTATGSARAGSSARPSRREQRIQREWRRSPLRHFWNRYDQRTRAIAEDLRASGKSDDDVRAVIRPRCERSWVGRRAAKAAVLARHGLHIVAIGPSGMLCVVPLHVSAEDVPTTVEPRFSKTVVRPDEAWLRSIEVRRRDVARPPVARPVAIARRAVRAHRAVRRTAAASESSGDESGPEPPPSQSSPCPRALRAARARVLAAELVLDVDPTLALRLAAQAAADCAGSLPGAA